MQSPTPDFEPAAVYRLPSGRFAMAVALVGDDEFHFHLVDINQMSLIDGEMLMMSARVMARCTLAWHAAEWRGRISERQRSEQQRMRRLESARASAV